MKSVNIANVFSLHVILTLSGGPNSSSVIIVMGFFSLNSQLLPSSQIDLDLHHG